MNAAFTLLAAVGLAIAALGLGIDFLLPDTSQGFSIAQLLLVAAGLLLALASLCPAAYRVAPRHFPKRGKNIGKKVSLITIITLLVLEFVLVALGFGTYYPAEMPEAWLEPVPWHTCDESGCRYVYDKLMEECDNGGFSGRPCIVNRQGYPDSEDFAVFVDTESSTRVLMLGDSFTAGYAADIGKSFVETVEANLPDSTIWNAAISATGTNQALKSFEVNAPLLRPQITILGFFTNDFGDNVTPIDSYFIGKDLTTNRVLNIRQYKVDVWGNVIKLDYQSDLYYRRHDVDPPASEFKRLVGLTRLGSLVLRMVDKLGAVIFEDARYNRTVHISRTYLKALYEAATEQDSALLVVLIPRPENLDTMSVEYQTAIDLMRELGIPFLDPINLLGPDDYAPVPEFHWNNAGHQKIGNIA